MRDPFAALKDALQRVFHLEAMRNGRYIYPEIRHLKQAVDNFQPNNKRNFIALLKALRASLPHIEKWRADFTTIRKSVDALAKELNLPIIQWNIFLSHSNTSPKFQFSALNHKKKEVELLSWLASKPGANDMYQNADTQVQLLLAYRDHFGFSQKLSTHLQKDPDFLFNIIMRSEKNFVQIAQTRLVLYLTDRQLAEAIIKHIPYFIQHHPSPAEQAAKLVAKLNEILSNGRSISTLLRNAEAKFILESSEFLQIYQNKEPQVPPASTDIEEAGEIKPTL